MLDGRNLILDTFSLVYQQLRPWCTAQFWDFSQHDPIPDSVYVIGRQQMVEHRDRILDLCEDPRYCVVFDNAAEGSWTLTSHLQALNIDQSAQQGKILIIAGADIGPDYRYITYEHFLCCIFDYQENLAAARHIDDIHSTKQKPYDFLFLNGRGRPHRKYLYERLRQENLLDRSLWTMLDGRPSLTRLYELKKDDVDLMATVSEIRSLPTQYEYQSYRDNVIHLEAPQRSFVKHDLFANTWGEIYLQPEAYVDTYFSLVTETVFEHPRSFRTEKIAKVLAMGHPWICAANPGFYRDLRDMGFQTFGAIIDETFDLVEDHQDRLERIIHTVKQILREPQAFLTACKSICKYNQQHLQEIGPRLRSDFPQRFRHFIEQHA